MRLGLCSDLIAHAWFQNEFAAIFKLRVQFTLQTQQDMTLYTPVVCQVPGCVLDHAHTDIAKITGPPVSHSCLTLVLRRFNGCPIGDSERYIAHLHRIFSKLALTS